MDMETFVENAKAICKNKNIAVSTACLNAGLSITWMSDIEKKHTRPRIDSVVAFAQYLGVTVSELLGEHKEGKFITLDDDTSYYIGEFGFEGITKDDVSLLFAYHKASPEIQRVIDSALEPYKEKETTSTGTG